MKGILDNLRAELEEEQANSFFGCCKKANFSQLLSVLYETTDFVKVLFKDEDWKKKNFMTLLRDEIHFGNFCFTKAYDNTKKKSNTVVWKDEKTKIVLKFRRYRKTDVVDFIQRCDKGDDVINSLTKEKKTPQIYCTKIDTKRKNYNCYLVAMGNKGLNLKEFKKALLRLNRVEKKTLLLGVLSNLKKTFRGCSNVGVIIMDSMLRNFAVRETLIPVLIDEENFKTFENKSNDEIEKKNKENYLNVKEKLLRNSGVWISDKELGIESRKDKL